MSLLREIQASLLDPDSEIGPILLKLRFLASRLGSSQLEEWVKYESDGYPSSVAVPEYRKIQITYYGTWSGPLGSGISNAPIPSHLVEKFAGKQWTDHEMRQSVAAVDDLAGGEGGILRIDASNLILLLQGKVYKGYACNSVVGEVSKTAMREIQNTVRNRILELTIELEKAVPAALDVTLAKPVGTEAGLAKTVTQVFNQTIHGNYTAVSNIGAGAQITLSIAQGDDKAVVSELVRAGIPPAEAEEFAEVLAGEEAQSAENPLGEKARNWLKQNIGKAIDGTWRIGVGIATKVIEEAALRYYGFK